LEAHNGDAAAYNLRGHAYNEAGDYVSAVRDLSQAIAMRPEFGEAYFHRGVAFIRSADYKRALADFRQSLKRDLDSFFLPYVHFNLASVFHAQGNYKQALRSLDKAIELNPRFHQAYQIRAQINRTLGNTELARSDLKRMATLASATDERK